MKSIWISYCTEYEAGWGQRPDGFIMAEDKEVMLEFIKTKGNSGEPAYFWRYDEPEEVWCTKKTLEEIRKKMTEGKIAHYSGRGFKLYKEI